MDTDPPEEEVLVGLDVGKGEHDATASKTAGETVWSQTRTALGQT